MVYFVLCSWRSCLDWLQQNGRVAFIDGRYLCEASRLDASTFWGEQTQRHWRLLQFQRYAIQCSALVFNVTQVTSLLLPTQVLLGHSFPYLLINLLIDVVMVPTHLPTVDLYNDSFLKSRLEYQTSLIQVVDKYMCTAFLPSSLLTYH